MTLERLSLVLVYSLQLRRPWFSRREAGGDREYLSYCRGVAMGLDR